LIFTTLISNGPIFPQSPTQAAVVDASLEYCINVSKKLGQPHTVITADQAIYEIALALRKKDPEKYSNVILRMGGFHLVVNFMGSVGMLMKGSGVEDILVQAGICHLGTANKIMSGKDYYLMLRAHTLLYSAILELYWSAFETWLIENNKDLDKIFELSSCLVDLAQDFKEKRVITHSLETATKALDNIQPMLQEFRKSPFCTTPTAELWFMYIDMVHIIQKYIHAERAGKWDTHLMEAQNMLPYLVVTGHYKYVSCLPHYINEMKNLPDTAPEVYQQFLDGNFCVRQTSGNFNAVWTDMALEKTYNRDAKTVLFHGITQKQATMDKYLKALPMLTAISEETKKMVHMSDAKDRNESPLCSAKNDIDAIRRLKNVIENDMMHPFMCKNSKELLNISTGEKATSLELIHAKTKGQALLKEAEDQGYDKIKNYKIKTFTTQHPRIQNKSQQIQRLYRDESSVTRSLYLVHNLDEKGKLETLSHEWAQYPPALFHPNNAVSQGYQMRSGNKADMILSLKKLLDDQWEEVEKIPDKDQNSCVYIIDAMAFIQRQQTLNCKTFGELQAKYRQRIIQQQPKGCHTIHFVGDRYDISPTISLKQGIREKRSSGKKEKEYEINAALDIPEWKSFIANLQNKASLLNFIGESWIAEHNTLPENVQLIIGGVLTNPGQTVLIKNTGYQELTDLACSNHEEADTRMFAHLNYSVVKDGCNVGLISSIDSDVIVLAMYYSVRIPAIKELWIQKADSCIPVHNIVDACAQKLSSDATIVTGILHNVYILTGCDTVSFIFNKTKGRALKIIAQQLNNLKKFGGFGEDPSITTEEGINEARFFFKCLYGRPDFVGNLDNLRAHIFATTDNDLRFLPSTEDAFYQHVLRTLMQISVNKASHLSNPEYPDPTQFGRHVVNGKLVPVLMLKSPKPTLAQKTVCCKCKQGRCLRGCSCAKKNVTCDVSCLCGGKPPQCGRAERSLLIQESSSDED